MIKRAFCNNDETICTRKEQAWYIVGLIAKELLSALLWAWIILACVARDSFTALMLLVAKSLIWPVIGREYRR